MAEEKKAKETKNPEKGAKKDYKISYPGEGSVKGYFYLKKGAEIPKFMKKDPKYKIAINTWFE